jgi:hypothetical protein
MIIDTHTHLYTAAGARVCLAKLENQISYELNTSVLTKGAYIIKLSTKDKTDYEKLVVQ